MNFHSQSLPLIKFVYDIDQYQHNAKYDIAVINSVNTLRLGTRNFDIFVHQTVDLLCNIHTMQRVLNETIEIARCYNLMN